MVSEHGEGSLVVFFKLPASWWFQPIWKIWSSNCTISLGKDENKKSFETTTQPIIHEDHQPNSSNYTG